MKKKLLLSTAIITAAVMPSVAQNNDPTIIGQYDSSNLNIIPSRFTPDGKSRIMAKEGLTKDNEEVRRYKFTIFDRNFKVEDSFEVTYPGIATYDEYYELMDGKWVQTSGGLLDRVTYHYGSEEIFPIDMNSQAVQSTYDTETYLFAGFFTNTSEYLYIQEDLQPHIRTEEYDSDRDGINDRRHVQHWTITAGYKVMSQSGKEICTVKIPDGYTGDGKINLYFMDGNKYMSCRVEKIDTSDESYTIIYEVDAATSSVRQMSAPIRVGVMPRVARRSEPVTVTFGDEGKASRRVKVTGMNGSTVIAESVAAGETATTIDTSALSQGVYVVTVEDGDKAVENCKIVIR